MRAIGLDVGFASFGWGIVDLDPDPRALALGVIRTAKDKRKVLSTVDVHRRGQAIVRELVEVLDLYPGIDVACAESVSFVRSAVVMAMIGRAWGIVDALLEQRRISLLQASPQEIKKRNCPGVKNPSKEDVQAAIELRFGPVVTRQLAKLPKGQHEHPTDALGAIVACMDRDELRLARAGSRGRQRDLSEMAPL